MDSERARLAISLVDLTNLADDCDERAVEELCARADAHGTAAVCVWPDFVAAAARLLDESPVGVATVVNFPTGEERPFSVGVQTIRALADGADEIDVVLPYRRLESGDVRRAADVLDDVRSATEGRALVKVILETGELHGSVEVAAAFAIEHGADFVKTSTGKSPVSATPEAMQAILDAIVRSGRPVGVKPSGGIGTVDAAVTYLDLAAAAMGESWISPATFRFGASSLLDALLAAA